MAYNQVNNNTKNKKVEVQPKFMRIKLKSKLTRKRKETVYENRSEETDWIGIGRENWEGHVQAQLAKGAYLNWQSPEFGVR